MLCQGSANWAPRPLQPQCLCFYENVLPSDIKVTHSFTLFRFLIKCHLPWRSCTNNTPSITLYSLPCFIFLSKMSPHNTLWSLYCRSSSTAHKAPRCGDLAVLFTGGYVTPEQHLDQRRDQCKLAAGQNWAHFYLCPPSFMTVLRTVPYPRSRLL
jgi:hypothetical protein